MFLIFQDKNGYTNLYSLFKIDLIHFNFLILLK
jgi:hypothetical protein